MMKHNGFHKLYNSAYELFIERSFYKYVCTILLIRQRAFSTADMTKNKGFCLAGPTEISVQRKQLKEIIFSVLPACTEPDLDTGLPFRAQAIIANPPALGGFCCYDTTLFSLPKVNYKFFL